MSDQEILEKAIKKAIAGGWECIDSGYDHSGYEVDPEVKVKMILEPCCAEDANSLYELIYNHKFAKALWGLEFPGDSADFVPETPEWVACNSGYDYWQYHLQQMVIAPDPIKYLGENL
jgi:hypothetical protein